MEENHTLNKVVRKLVDAVLGQKHLLFTAPERKLLTKEFKAIIREGFNRG